MLFKKIIAGLLLMGPAIGITSNEWNDSLIGYIAERDNAVVLAYKTSCPKHILATIPVKYKPLFSAAKIIDAQGEANGCWAPYNDDVVIFVWEGGGYGWMFQHDFRLLRGT